MNIISSDNSILITALGSCDYDLKAVLSPFNFFKQDSGTIALSGLGTSISKLNADVKISSNPANKLSVDATGLRVLIDPVVVTDQFVKISPTDTISGFLSNKLIEGQYIKLEVENLTYNETLKVSIDETALDNHFLQMLEGVEAPQTPITAVPTSTVNLSTSGVDNHTVTANVKISTEPGNALINNGGLYVSTPPDINVPVITADNGLTKTDNNIQLGGTLLGNTRINTASYRFLISSDTNSNNTPETVLEIQRNAAGSNAQNGIGASLDFGMETSLGIATVSTRLTSTWVDAIDATRKSNFEIININNGFFVNSLKLKETGQLVLPQYLTNSSFTGTAVAGLGYDSSGNVISLPTTTAVDNVENGLNIQDNVAKLGGSLIEDTLISGAEYDLALNPRKVVIGNLYTDVYGVDDPIANTRPLLVRSQSTLNSEGSGSISAYHDLIFNGSGTFGAGRGYVSSDAALRLTIGANVTIPLSSVVASNYGVLQILNTSAGDITTSDSRPVAPYIASVQPQTGYSGNTGKISHVAGFATIPVFQVAGGNNYTEITNYSGIFLSPSDEVIIEGSKLVNKFGVNQVGSADANIFKGNISYYGTLTNASDERIKENIEDYTKGLDVIKQLRVVDFNYIEKYKRPEEGKHIGVIAQELEEILPEAVRTTVEGEFTDFRTVNQSVLIFALINAVKQLSKELDELKTVK